jgi:hypothetical protein
LCLKNQSQYISKKLRCSVSIGTLQLNSIEISQQGPFVTSGVVQCFVVPIKIYKNNMTINANALIDSGATASFIDFNFIEKYKLPMKLRNRPTQVEVIDGKTIESGTITYESKPLDISLDNFTYKVAFNIIKSPNNPIILGQNWLEVYNPEIDWQNKKLTFSKPTIIVEASFKNKSKSKVEKEIFEKNQ